MEALFLSLNNRKILKALICGINYEVGLGNKFDRCLQLMTFNVNVPKNFISPFVLLNIYFIRFI